MAEEAVLSQVLEDDVEPFTGLRPTARSVTVGTALDDLADRSRCSGERCRGNESCLERKDRRRFGARGGGRSWSSRLPDGCMGFCSARVGAVLIDTTVLF